MLITLSYTHIRQGEKWPIFWLYENYLLYAHVTRFASPRPLYKSEKNSSKVPFVGTLNLCLETPDTMQKTRHKSELPGLRKRPKTVENWVKSNFAFFQQFLDVFSSHDDRINFSSFALCQASQDTSLEYPQRVLWRKFFFDL